jgi:hypothetical protein
MIATRRAGALVVLVLLCSWATRGLCLMPATGGAGPRDAHGCCKKGWTQGTPECCMTGAADQEPARTATAKPLAEPRPAVMPSPFLPDLPYAGRAVPAVDRSHPPPGPLPLRI